MNIYAIWPLSAVLDGAYALLTTLTDLLSSVAGSSAAVLALVVLTVLLRTILLPVGISQMRAQRDRLRLAPQLGELRRRFAKEPEKLQRETMELYKREKTSPFAGCLPVLIQTPVLAAVYGLFLLPTIGGSPNSLLASEFLGVPLGIRVTDEVVSGAATGQEFLVIGLVVVALAVVATLSRLVQLSIARRTIVPRPAGVEPTPQEEMMERLAKPMSYAVYASVVFAVFTPIAAGIYLFMTMTWGVCERFVLSRIYLPKPGGAAGAVVAPDPAPAAG